MRITTWSSMRTTLTYCATLQLSAIKSSRSALYSTSAEKIRKSRTRGGRHKRSVPFAFNWSTLWFLSYSLSTWFRFWSTWCSKRCKRLKHVYMGHSATNMLVCRATKLLNTPRSSWLCILPTVRKTSSRQWGIWCTTSFLWAKASALASWRKFSRKQTSSK